MSNWISLKYTPWEGLDGWAEEELAALRPAAERAMGKMSARLQAEAQRTLSGPRHGRLYHWFRRHKAQEHVASAPGEAPAEWTLRLKKSVRIIKARWKGWTVSGGVQSRDPAAGVLEFGGTVGVGKRIRIAKRPWLEPSAVKAEPALHQIMVDELGL